MANSKQPEMNLVNAFKTKAAVKSAPGLTLHDTLNVKSTQALKKLASGYRIKGYTKLDREGLLHAVGEALLVPGRMEEVIYILEPAMWSLFTRTAKTECLTDDRIHFADCDLLQSFGYVQSYYYNGHYHYVMPQEVRAVYASLKKDSIVSKKERAELLHGYATAVTQLYGVITQDDFVALFNSQNAKHTDIDESFQALIRQVAVERSSYCFWDEYLVSDEFEDDDFEGVKALLSQVGDKPRYIPEKRELLKYADLDYYEQTPATRALYAYVVKELAQDAELAQCLVDELHEACAAECPMAERLEIFHDEDIPLSMERMQTLATLISDVSNGTRLWVNNGHTPNELFEKFERKALRPLPANQAKTKKIGRNDLCPCGSGKKYKKCCGR